MSTANIHDMDQDTIFRTLILSAARTEATLQLILGELAEFKARETNHQETADDIYGKYMDVVGERAISILATYSEPIDRAQASNT